MNKIHVRNCIFRSTPVTNLTLGLKNLLHICWLRPMSNRHLGPHRKPGMPSFPNPSKLKETIHWTYLYKKSAKIKIPSVFSSLSSRPDAHAIWKVLSSPCSSVLPKNTRSMNYKIADWILCNDMNCLDLGHCMK